RTVRIPLRAVGEPYLRAAPNLVPLLDLLDLRDDPHHRLLALVELGTAERVHDGRRGLVQRAAPVPVAGHADAVRVAGGLAQQLLRGAEVDDELEQLVRQLWRVGDEHGAFGLGHVDPLSVLIARNPESTLARNPRTAPERC